MNKLLAKILTCRIKNKEERRQKRNELINGIKPYDKVKLIMTLVVKNEEEIIETHLRFHKAMGVDGFIVTNHNSTDKTLEILNRLKDEGLVLEVITETSVQHQHNVWVNKMVHIAEKKYHADWVINSDADEFYYSKDLNLKKSLCKYPKLNVVKVESTFSFPSENNRFLENPYFNTNPIKDFEYAFMDKDDEYSRYFSLESIRTCPKVIHKTKGFIEIIAGNHDVIMKNKVMGNNVDICLYHYHITNYRRYEEKAKRWSDSAKYITPGKDNYLTNIIQLLRENKLKDFYDQYYGPEMKQMLESKGIITKDYSVYNFLKYNGIK